VKVAKIQLRDMAGSGGLLRRWIEKAHLLGPILKELLRESLPCNSTKEDGRTVHYVAIMELICR